MITFYNNEAVDIYNHDEHIATIIKYDTVIGISVFLSSIGRGLIYRMLYQTQEDKLNWTIVSAYPSGGIYNTVQVIKS